MKNLLDSPSYSKMDTSFWNPTIYTDASKSGRSGNKSEKINKVAQNSYNSVQKPQLDAIFMVLLEFPESLNVGTLFMQ